eukprot:GGOE01061852.1.p1 GENE.GGOE01061852.1~~GGOE01061852.1.p1  ORF type:complete len:424 (-),score=121.13 GGOE01061852.1:296-1531(-)
MWAWLPPDAQLWVCLYLGPRDLVQLERCSLALCRAARRPEVWRELCRLTFPTMYEGIVAKGQLCASKPAASQAKEDMPVVQKSLMKRSSARDVHSHVTFLLPEEGDVDVALQQGIEASLHDAHFAAITAATNSPSASSASSSTCSGKRSKRATKARGVAAHPAKGTAEGEQAIREGESAVGLLVSELRAQEDEVRRCERQRAVLYEEDTAAREELTVQIEELQAVMAELQESIVAKEQDLMDLHLTHGTAASLDWQRVFALRTLKQQHWARRKSRKQERQEVLQANKSLDPNYNRSLRVTARQRTCTTCCRRFVVDENAEGACHFHPGRFIHDDARCICGGSVRRDRPTIDAEMAHNLKKQMLKSHGRPANNVNMQVRRGLGCTFTYTCCGARDVRTPGCASGKHTWRHFK